MSQKAGRFEMEEEVYCENCAWEGFKEELVDIDEDEDSFIYCPYCKSGHICDLD